MPLVSVLFALVVPLLYRQESVPLMRSAHGLSRELTWWGWYVFGAALLGGCLVANAVCNALSTGYRLDGRKDWHLSVYISVAGMFSTLLTLRFATPLWVLEAWCGLVLASWAVQWLLLRTLPDVSAPEPIPSALVPLLARLAAKPDEPTSPGEPFYYSEAGGFGASTGTLPRSIAIRFWVGNLGFAVFMGLTLWWTSKSLLEIVWMLVAFVVFSLWHSHNKGPYIKVTPKRIRARSDGRRPLNIRMEDVVRCEVVEAMPSPDDYLVMRVDLPELLAATQSEPNGALAEHAYLLNIVRRLEIETRSGNVHKFRLRDPDKACRLVNSALTALRWPSSLEE